MEEGVTEVVIAAAHVSLGEVTATLLTVSVPEVGTIVPGRVVVADPAAVVAAVDVEFIFETVESLRVVTPLGGVPVIATVVPVADLVVPTPTWVVASLFVLAAVGTTAVATDVLVTSGTVGTVVDALPVELNAFVVPWGAAVVEPTEAVVEVPRMSVVGEGRDVAVWADNVLPLVVAPIPRVVNRVSIWAPASTEVVIVAAVAAVTGDGVLVEAAWVAGPLVAGTVASSSVLASLSESSVVESDALVGAEAEWTVSMEVVGPGAVPWYVVVASAVELVTDARKVVVAITGVVFGLLVGVAFVVVPEVIG